MNPFGRPKIPAELKAVKISVSLRPAQIEHVKKNGGSKYLQNLLDREISKSAQSAETADNAQHDLEKSQKTAKNLDSNSVLIRKLKELSQNFSSD